MEVTGVCSRGRSAAAAEACCGSAAFCTLPDDVSAASHARIRSFAYVAPSTRRSYPYQTLRSCQKDPELRIAASLLLPSANLRRPILQLEKPILRGSSRVYSGHTIHKSTSTARRRLRRGGRNHPARLSRHFWVLIGVVSSKA